LLLEPPPADTSIPPSIPSPRRPVALEVDPPTSPIPVITDDMLARAARADGTEPGDWSAGSRDFGGSNDRDRANDVGLGGFTDLGLGLGTSSRPALGEGGHVLDPESAHALDTENSHVLETGSAHDLAPASAHVLETGSAHDLAPASAHDLAPASAHVLDPEATGQWDTHQAWAPAAEATQAGDGGANDSWADWDREATGQWDTREAWAPEVEGAPPATPTRFTDEPAAPPLPDWALAAEAPPSVPLPAAPPPAFRAGAPGTERIAPPSDTQGTARIAPPSDTERTARIGRPLDTQRTVRVAPSRVPAAPVAAPRLIDVEPPTTTEPRSRHAAPILQRFTPSRVALAGLALAVFGGGVAWLAHSRGEAPVAAAPVAAPPPPLSSPPLALPPTTPKTTRPRTTTPKTTTPRTTTPKVTTPSPVSSGPVSLAGWKLTIPEASAKGSAVNITPAVNRAPWLGRDGNGGLKFWAPVAGETTPNSKHARTELDSLHNFTAGQGHNVLSGNLTLSQAPKDGGDVIVGQLHGAEDISSSSFVMLHWDNGTLRAAVKQVLKGPTSNSYPLLTGVPLGSTFSYTISDLGNGNVTISVNWNGKSGSKTVPIPSVFRGQTVRFQAGAYQQGETSSGSTDGARLTFHSLRETH
jgi:hypothetical protein